MKGLKMKQHLEKIKSDIWGEVLLKNKTKKETYVGHGLGCGLTHGLSVLFHLSRIIFSLYHLSFSKPLYADVFKLPFCLSFLCQSPPPPRKPCQSITGLTISCVNSRKECHGRTAVRFEVGAMEAAFC